MMHSSGFSRREASLPAALSSLDMNAGTSAALLSVKLVEELRAQNMFLEKRVQYLYTVSATFRQKVALMIRECLRTTHMGPAELQRLYHTAMEEVAKAEHDVNNADASVFVSDESIGGANDGQQQRAKEYEALLLHLKNARKASTSGTSPAAGSSSLVRSAEAKEDVRKAHLICVALQEKHQLKQAEMELKRNLGDLQQKYDDLAERHKRMVLLQSGCGPSSAEAGSQNVAAMRELYEGRIKELEDTILSMKKSQVLGERLNNNALVVASSVTGDDGDDDLVDAAPRSRGAKVTDQAVDALARQNHLLKARLGRMKEELTQLKQQSLGSTMQLNEGLDSLLMKINDQQRLIDDKEQQIRELQSEKRELAKECVAHRSQVEMYVKQVELFARDADTSQLSHARRAQQSKGEAENLSSAVDEYLQQIHQKDSVIQSLMTQLRDEKQAHQEKVLEVRALGAHLETFRAKLDALQTQQTQKEMHHTMVGDMQARLFAAVDTIQRTQNTSALTAKLDELSSKLRDMETADLQLRQKEDELVLLRDEHEQLKDEKQELVDALSSISSLFLHFPKSVVEVEKIIVEREELLEEATRCAQQRCPPDLVRVEGKVDFRLLAAAQQRKKNKNTKQRQQRDAGSGTAAHSPVASHSGLTDTDADCALDEDDQRELELERQLAAIMDIPPLPPLCEFTEPLSASALSAPPPMTATQATLAATSPPRLARQELPGLGFLSPSGGPGTVQDVHLTFQLFDDQGTGVLGAEIIKLCLATLGINKALPLNVTHMSEDQFLTFCCGQQPDDVDP